MKILQEVDYRQIDGDSLKELGIFQLKDGNFEINHTDEQLSINIELLSRDNDKVWCVNLFYIVEGHEHFHCGSKYLSNIKTIGQLRQLHQMLFNKEIPSKNENEA